MSRHAIDTIAMLFKTKENWINMPEMVQLESQGNSVYYVKPGDLVNVGDDQIYTQGYCHRELNSDLQKFYRYFDRNGRAPPAHYYSDCFPDLTRIQPGIEIFAGSNLFKQGGRLFSFMMETHRMDFTGADYYAYQEFVRKKRSRLDSIETFLFMELYSHAKEGTQRFSRRVIEIISTYHQHPEEVYELQVLEKEQASMKPYGSVDLEEAIKQGVHVNIDWFLANKILALFAVVKGEK